ncbi:MAG: threonine synthase, partial [Candidatus Bathyarchaeia archaeon]
MCKKCFGPLEVIYQYDSLNLKPGVFAKRPRTIWRYRELLPVGEASQIVDLGVGFTPLRRAKRLGDILDVKELYVKDDTVNPSGSFKDRPAAVAVTKALDFKAAAVGCASTGNLAAAVAAHAAKAGLPCYVFIPAGTEAAKTVQASSYGAKIVVVQGTYDDANRLAAEAAERYGWAFANINVRPYYVEGSKTLAFETCEQLSWTTPDRAIIPVGSGALLCAIHKGFQELAKVGLIERDEVRMTGAQPEGCSPVVSAFRNGCNDILPVERPETVAKSLAIGDPGDGLYAARTIAQTAGFAESVPDWEIVDAIRLLAKTEGVFA